MLDDSRRELLIQQGATALTGLDFATGALVPGDYRQLTSRYECDAGTRLGVSKHPIVKSLLREVSESPDTGVPRAVAH